MAFDDAKMNLAMFSRRQPMRNTRICPHTADSVVVDPKVLAILGANSAPPNKLVFACGGVLLRLPL
jgi:hypothetical protein